MFLYKFIYNGTLRNAEHFRRLYGIARPEVMHWAHKNGYNSGCAVVILIIFGMQAQLQQLYATIASAKFVAHSEGEIRAENWTWVKINIFLTKIGAISINQLLDSYCRYLMQEVTVL